MWMLATQKELLWRLGKGMTSRTDRCSCSGGCADAWRADGTRAGLGQILAQTGPLPIFRTTLDYDDVDRTTQKTGEDAGRLGLESAGWIADSETND